ncbi:nicotinate (nicotinamide) nucleotide adenylyltransferase [Candidatus Pseudoscillospira sp. SGI.172]|uniref:nicotinate (nicotinamide) nucleotide adenylyltransferase n=1 Tax=Candidatus Pseudoscillospira sp. SGI.172 TaxID=3420582 RepID=UPI003D0586EF
MKIGIYGGTFNPPHLGHMTSARLAMEMLGLDRLLFVPAAIPPHKALPEGSPSPEDRLAMTVIAADSLLLRDKVAVDDLELRREGKSFTVDTLRQFREEYPGDELWFLMGSDMLFSLPDWHLPEEICALAGLAAFARSEGDEPERMEVQAEQLRADYGARVTVLRLPEVVEVSSTRLRAQLAGGEGAEFLPPSVYGYILRMGLYGTHKDLRHLTDAELRACSLSMVYAKRHAHILGVEEEAVRLARRWGADEELARRAGILHDCTKYLELEQQLQICDEYGIVLDDLERISVKLLHSKTGAALARHLYGQPEEICQAIFWHTTGKADMTRLEKIIYLADYMEPNRDFPGVEELRKLCYEDLDAALQMGLEMSIEELRERGVPIHRNTQGALEWLLEHRKG